MDTLSLRRISVPWASKSFIVHTYEHTKPLVMSNTASAGLLSGSFVPLVGFLVDLSGESGRRTLNKEMQIEYESCLMGSIGL